MTRLERILDDIESFSNDAFMDGYHAGYDESWDEARDKGFDEGHEMGYQKSLDDVMEMVDMTGYVMVPETREECTDMIESFKDNGPLCVMLYMNYIGTQIKSLEQ